MVNRFDRRTKVSIQPFGDFCYGWEHFVEAYFWNVEFITWKIEIAIIPIYKSQHHIWCTSTYKNKNVLSINI